MCRNSICVCMHALDNTLQPAFFNKRILVFLFCTHQHAAGSGSRSTLHQPTCVTALACLCNVSVTLSQDRRQQSVQLGFPELQGWKTETCGKVRNKTPATKVLLCMPAGVCSPAAPRAALWHAGLRHCRHARSCPRALLRHVCFVDVGDAVAVARLLPQHGGGPPPAALRAGVLVGCMVAGVRERD